MTATHIEQVLTRHATVEASAGSGKTYLLVSRLVRLLLDGVHPGAVLAITFTRKAAAEMQHRLLERLYELCHCDDALLNEKLDALALQASETNRQRARTLYETVLRSESSVKTTTFHSFCQELLRRFPLEADVPPGFELIERSRALQQQAWEALMTEAGENPASDTAQALSQLFEQLGLYSSRTALNSFITYRSDWWAYTQRQAEPVSYAIERLKLQLDIEDNIDPLQQFLASQTIHDKLLRFAVLLGKHATKTNTQHIADIHDGLQQSEPDFAFSQIKSAFLTQQGSPRSRKINKTLITKLGDTGAEEYLQLHGQLCQNILTLEQQLAAITNFVTNQAWYLAGQAYLAHYQRIKLEQRLLDFTDLEWKTYQLLNQDDSSLWVQYKLDERIDHFLIDEFQDTNPTQWHMLLPLLQELINNSEVRQRGIFLVGDAKQSIYRFRRAEPRLFGNASDWLEQSCQAVRFPLNKSWRSSPAVIQFVNHLFSDGELQSHLTDFQLHETHQTNLWGQVHLLPLCSEEKQDTELSQTISANSLRNPLDQPREESVHTRYRMEAQQIADEIRNLINGKTLIGDENKARELRYSDIMILLRKRTHIQTYEKALRKAGIPYLGADRGTLLDSLEVTDMINLLQWLTMPFDNLALAGILRSPLFSASNEELMLLAGNGSWFSRLQTVVNTLPHEHTLHRANRMLSAWCELAGYIPVHDLLDKIYSEANVLARYSASFPLHLSGRLVSNLTRFLELALEMDSGRYPSLMRFIAWLDELKQQSDDAPDEPAGIGENDRVKIMTIHASKGLESPVVFLADTARTDKRHSTYASLVNWPVDTMQPDTLLLSTSQKIRDPLSEQELERLQADERREEANLLYVAVTRSKQLLYISGSLSSRQVGVGWYGDICSQYQLDHNELDEATLLETCNTPPSSGIMSEQVESETIDIAAELAKPLHIESAWQEIAPSRSENIAYIQQASSTDVASADDEDARQRGIIIHQILEQIISQPELDIDTFCKRNQINANGSELREWWQEAMQVYRHPQLQYLFDAKKYERACNEVPVYYYKGESLVHGIIDRLVFEADKVHLVDYKTHQCKQVDELPIIARKYEQQMSLYAEGIRKMWPDKKLETALLFTHCAQIYPCKV